MILRLDASTEDRRTAEESEKIARLDARIETEKTSAKHPAAHFGWRLMITPLGFERMETHWRGER